MTKKEAEKADTFLKTLVPSFNRVMYKSHLEDKAKSCGLDNEECSFFAALFISDGYLEHNLNDVPGSHLYKLTDQGFSFVKYKGGYLDQIRNESYDKANTKFTFIRHWVWFWTALVSLILNAYLILKYLLNWI